MGGWSHDDFEGAPVPLLEEIVRVIDEEAEERRKADREREFFRG